MRVGINLPWFGYGWDFGGPPHYGRGPDDWRNTLGSHLAELHSAGIEVVRWFILGDGFILGTHGQQPTLSDGHWRFPECPPLHSEALEDWERALSLFREAGMQMLPCVIDFKAAEHGIRSSSAPGYTKQGRADLFLPDGARQFFDRVLLPLLEAAAEYRELIYAWDIVNEPEWIVERHPRVGVADLRNFIATGARLVMRMGFKCTVGFAREGTFAIWSPFEREGSRWPHTHIRPAAQRRFRQVSRTPPAPSGFIHQFHYYTNYRSRPLPDPMPRPMVLGEFATRTGVDAWPELSSGQGTAERLSHLSHAGVALALPWSYPELNGDAYTAEQWSDLKREMTAFITASE